MLKEALEDALSRGEKIRQDITKEILNSQVFSDLANNPRFINAVARVIHSKAEVARSLQKRVKEVLQAMNIPTRQQLHAYERRVLRLERELDAVSRRTNGAPSRNATTAKKAKSGTKKRRAKTKKTARKAARKKVSAANKRASR